VSGFIKAVKSTIDFHGHNIGTNYAGGSVATVDMNTDINVDELLASDAPAILWELVTCSEAPREPMWDVSFMIGAKTSKGTGYARMSLLEAVTAVMKPGSSLSVHDYSGTVAGPQVGFLSVTAVDLDPEQEGRFAGVRLVAVRCKGLSW